MFGVNRVTLIGNVVKKPDIHETSSGQKIASFKVATTESWKDKEGERQEKTEWHNIVIFNKPLAECAENYLKKGSRIYIEGSLRTNKWTDKNGADRYTTEVVIKNYSGVMILLDGKDKTGRCSTVVQSLPTEDAELPLEDAFNDDIPF